MSFFSASSARICAVRVQYEAPWEVIPLIKDPVGSSMKVSIHRPMVSYVGSLTLENTWINVRNDRLRNSHFLIPNGGVRHLGFINLRAEKTDTKASF
jgi:hypothetical protein